MVKELSETLAHLAAQIDNLHGEDSDWWKGFVAGIRRSASLAEVHEAFRVSEAE